MENEKKEILKAGTKMSEDVISLIETRNTGFLVSISRTIKVGRTASELSCCKMEGYARTLDEAFVVIGQLDHATNTFIKTEAAFYGIDLASQPNKPSPVEMKKE